MPATPPYSAPEGPLTLSGPVTPVETGELPVRGDLAHVALAGRYFVAHYAVPQPATIAKDGAAMLATPADDAQTVAALDAGQQVEVLDRTSEWAWVCLGPDGPAGYLRLRDLTD